VSAFFDVIVYFFSGILAHCFPSKKMLDKEAVDREWDVSGDDADLELRDPKPWP
jgi:hypothetical protein